MKFKRIKLVNYRCFKNLDIEFSTDNDKPITLIQGGYGSGKTVFIDSFYWILSNCNIYPTYYQFAEIINNDIYNQLMDREISEAEVYGELEFEFRNFEYKVERKDVYSVDSKLDVEPRICSNHVLFKRNKNSYWTVIAIDEDVLSILSDMMPKFLVVGTIQVRSSYYDLLSVNPNCCGNPFKSYIDELRNNEISYISDHAYRYHASQIRHLMDSIQVKNNLSSSLIGTPENPLSEDGSSIKIPLFDENDRHTLLSRKLELCERYIENITSFNKKQETCVLESINVLLNEAYCIFDQKKDYGIRSVMGVYNDSYRYKLLSYDPKKLQNIITELQATGDFDNRILLNMDKGYNQNDAYNKVFEDIIIDNIETVSMSMMDIHILALIKAIYDYVTLTENAISNSINSYPLVIDYSWCSSNEELFSAEYFSDLLIPKQVVAVNLANHPIREDFIKYIGKSYYFERNEKESVIRDGKLISGSILNSYNL